MRIDHAGEVVAPEVPAGVVVRRGAFDDASRWAAHEAMIESFRGQFGFVPRPHDEWVEALDAMAVFDWSQLTVLEVEGRAVAVRLCNDMFGEHEKCGYLGMLGVVEEFRGRGLAKFLLRDAFAIDAAAGWAGTILNVDTNNPTPALRLYLSVGMKPTLVFDGWRRLLPTS
jgi:ribosomal protein S18 acetylase RimI-like enzyme